MTPAQDPVGIHLSRRSRAGLAALGWTPDRPNLLLRACGIDPVQLVADLSGSGA